LRGLVGLLLLLLLLLLLKVCSYGSFDASVRVVRFGGEVDGRGVADTGRATSGDGRGTSCRRRGLLGAPVDGGRHLLKLT